MRNFFSGPNLYRDTRPPQERSEFLSWRTHLSPLRFLSRVVFLHLARDCILLLCRGGSSPVTSSVSFCSCVTTDTVTKSRMQVVRASFECGNVARMSISRFEIDNRRRDSSKRGAPILVSKRPTFGPGSEVERGIVRVSRFACDASHAPYVPTSRLSRCLRFRMTRPSVSYLCRIHLRNECTAPCSAAR